MERVGKELGKIIFRVYGEDSIALHSLVGGEEAVFGANFLVLLNWAASWQIRQLLPSELANPCLDEMHQPLFAVLMKMGLEPSEAEDFVHQRYAEYWDALKTREGADGLRHICACFIGYCNDDGYSLEMLKIVRVFTQVAGYCKAIQEVLPRLLEESR